MTLKFLHDFNKTISDLLKKKHFEHDRTVEVAVDQTNCLSWKVKQKLKGTKCTSELTLKEKESGLGSMEITFKSSDSVELELTTKELCDNSEVKVKVVETKVQGTAKYVTDKFAAQSVFEYDGTTYGITPSFTFPVMENLQVGATAKITDGQLDDYNLGAQFTQDGRVFSLQTGNKFDSATLSAFSTLDVVGLNHELGFACNVSNLRSEMKPALSFAGKCALDNKSTLRYKVAGGTDLNLGYQYAFNKNVKVNMGTSLCMTTFALRQPSWKMEFTC